MQAKVRRLCTIFLSRRLMRATAALGLLSVFVFAFAQAGLAQTTPLKFENNYFVAGDYVVGGVGLRGLGVNGFATGTIRIPDPNQPNSTSVPAGADVVAAFLYWQTVESSQTLSAGQNGFFRGYSIAGVPLGNPNAPTSWSSGGCSGSSQGSKTMQVYRADVRPYLPVDLTTGIVQPNTSYEVRLADSGSNGGSAPLTLGATLVIIYRVLSPDFPLNAIVLYDGAFAPANGSSTMTQTLQGFYQPATSPISKLTHIVGNGQDNKFQTVYLNGVALSSLYGSLPPFPGRYNGSWDNPTWNVSNALNAPPNDPSETTSVVPTASNSGCVNWGAVIFSTTVQDADGDGLLDYWEQAPPNPVNPNPPGSDPGYVDVGSGQFVALPGANPAQRDIFIQIDYMCSIVNPDGTCDTTTGYSFAPSPTVLTMMSNAFSGNGHGINVHYDVKNSILEQTCTAADEDHSTSPPALCEFPNQPGVVGWKGGFVFLKNEPLNTNPATGQTYTETECEQNPATCVRRFQPGRKDSYHYIISGHALGVANWDLPSGTLTSVVASGSTVTFTTSTPHGLVVDPNAGSGRVSISDAISNPNLNGTYYVQSVPSPTSFTIQIATATNATYTLSTDPNLALSSGQAGTVSGFSDVGGADSVVTLGNWGADGQTTSVQAGTFMHEFGHTLALSHGGYFYDTPGSYVPTVGANCKANFQSVMSYLFQFDLLDGVVDYSEQSLNLLNENSLSGMTGLTPATFYSTTKWYTSVPPPAGTAATRHCDGTPLSPLTDPQPTMYRVEGATDLILPAWLSGQDTNFDGTINASLRGYDDWANIDLRQIGATGSLSAGGGVKLGGGGGTRLGGGGGTRLGGGGGTRLGGGGGVKIGGGGGVKIGGGGIASSESTHQAANSVTRPPRNLTDTPTDTRTSHSVALLWNRPTFGQVSYNVYRGANVLAPPPPVTTTSYTDSAVNDCTTYTYFVSSVLISSDPTLNGNESVPSNSVQYSVPCPPTGLTAALTETNGVGSIALNWTAASTASGAIYQYKIYRDDGSGSGVLLLNTVSPLTTDFTDSPVINNTAYTYHVTAVLVDQQGCLAGQYCRESSAAIATINVHWTVDSTTTITSITPSPSILGQSFTVYFAVAPVSGSLTPTGSVTVSDVSGATCTGTLSGGNGSCLLTLPVFVNGQAAVGTRTIIATYGGDFTFNGSSGSKNQQVIFKFTGFFSPLKAAGICPSSSSSGIQKRGSGVPFKWRLQDANNNLITSLNTIVIIEDFGGSGCGAPGTGVVLYSPVTGLKGGSTLKYDTGSGQFHFVWDTGYQTAAGIHTVVIRLADGRSYATTINLK